MEKLRKHLSPGVLLGIVAIVIALAGTSIAAITPSSDSVGAAALKRIVTRTATTTLGAGGGTGAATATCKGNQQVISGGVRFSVIVNGAGVSDMHVQGNGWEARGFNVTSAPVAMKVEAYCLKK